MWMGNACFLCSYTLIPYYFFLNTYIPRKIIEITVPSLLRQWSHTALSHTSVFDSFLQEEGREIKSELPLCSWFRSVIKRGLDPQNYERASTRRTGFPCLLLLTPSSLSLLKSSSWRSGNPWNTARAGGGHQDPLAHEWKCQSLTQIVLRIQPQRYQTTASNV